MSQTQKKKIAIDITTLLDQYSKRGIGNYTRKLVEHIILEADIEFHLFGFLKFKDNFKFKQPENVKFHSLGPIQLSRASINRKIASNIQKLAKNIQINAYFCPNFEKGLPNGNFKKIVTIHDLIPLQTKSFSSKSFIHNFIKKLVYTRKLKEVVNKADNIITHSEYSKLIIQKYFQDTLPQVINLGVDQDKIGNKKDSIKTLNKYKIKNDYILYYGGLEKNKNVESLLNGFYYYLKSSDSNLNLVLISKDIRRRVKKVITKSKRAEKIVNLAEKLNILDRIIFTSEVSNSELTDLVSAAKIFIHLSLFEGFGLSVLEAVSNSVPTIASNIPVYREIFEDSVLYANPDNPNEISSRIKAILENKELVRDLKKSSKEILSKYSWKITAKQTLEVLTSGKKIQDIQKGELKATTPNPQHSNKQKKTVTFLSTNFFPFQGGAENYTLDIAKRLVKDNFTVQVLTQKHDSNLENTDKYLGIKIKRYKSNLNTNSHYLRFSFGLIKSILSCKTDILHVQGFGFVWNDLSLILKRIFVGKRVKFICTPHGPFMARSDYSIFSRIFKSVYTFIQKIYLNWLYDIILTVNPNQHSWISRDYGINPEKIKFLPIGIEEIHFKQQDFYEKDLKIELGKKDVLGSFLGRFHKYKGVLDILEMLKFVIPTNPNFKFVFMGGDAGELHTLKKEIIEARLDKNVQVLEKPSDTLRNRILDKSELFIFPSEWEAYGIAVLEAMAHGNAVISSKTEGGQHLIKINENGLLVNYKDVKQIKDATEKLISDTKLRRKLIKNNVEKAKDLSWTNVWSEYQHLYK